jgi:hypothetical protein
MLRIGLSTFPLLLAPRSDRLVHRGHTCTPSSGIGATDKPIQPYTCTQIHTFCWSKGRICVCLLPVCRWDRFVRLCYATDRFVHVSSPAGSKVVSVCTLRTHVHTQIRHRRHGQTDPTVHVHTDSAGPKVGSVSVSPLLPVEGGIGLYVSVVLRIGLSVSPLLLVPRSDRFVW